MLREHGSIRTRDDVSELTSPLGDPPALPGRQQEFDKSCSGTLCSRLSRPSALRRWVRGFDFDRLRSGPFEGPATGKPPALPEDHYFRPLKQVPREATRKPLHWLECEPQPELDLSGSA